MPRRLKSLTKQLDPRRAAGRGDAAVWLWALLIGLIAGYAAIGFRLVRDV